MEIRFEDIQKHLALLDKVIFEESDSEANGLITGVGGCALYFSNRYRNTSNLTFHNRSIDLLEKIVEFTNRNPIQTNISIAYPPSAAIWIIDCLVRNNLIDNDELASSSLIADSIIETNIEKELEDNFHDLFYGFIGSTLILVENDRAANRFYINNVIRTLTKNSLKDENGIYWNTPHPFYPSASFIKTVNFGIPHGTCGIILFLLKCCDVYKMHEELKPLIEKSITWLIKQLDLHRNKLPYVLESSPEATGRLGWCYGDQAIPYTLLRHYETFGCERAKTKAYEVIQQAAAKRVDQASIMFYKDYGYYDMCICHGTSSVAYMWQKMYHITKDETIKQLSNKWINITLDNLEVFLPQLEKISEIEKSNNEINTSMEFLNGLSGVGLALISFLDPKLSDWDRLLLLDRPGRE
jgi:lantibiotic modifying enzyme